MIQRIINNKVQSIFILLIIHFLFRFLLLTHDVFPFNADEAVVGLMAKHILGGENFLYFYGQSYMGSVDAYIISFAFSLLGEEILVIRIVQIFLYSITIIFFYLYVDLLFNNRKISFLSALLFVFPVVNVILYTTISLGGYGEALLLGTISLYLSEVIKKRITQNHNNRIHFALLGFACGLGLFINPLSLTIIIPAILNVVIKLFQLNKTEFTIGTVNILFFFIIGSLPFWYSLFVTNGLATINEIGGSAVAVENVPFISRTISHIISFILFGITVIFGFRAPWNADWIGIYVIPLVLFFWCLILYLLFRLHHKRTSWLKVIPLICIAILVVFGFVFTSFGIDPSGRYFLPLIIPLSTLFGFSVVSLNKKFIWVLAIITVGYHLYGTFDAAKKEPYLTSQFYSPSQIDQSKLEELSDFLISHNQNYGFSNYWISYPLDFVSNEKIIVVPLLPYHPDLRYTKRDNRIEKYNDFLIHAERFFYITSNNPKLDQLLVDAFKINTIEYKFKNIGDYNIYYALSKKVTPENLGITDEFK